MTWSSVQMLLVELVVLSSGDRSGEGTGFIETDCNWRPRRPMNQSAFSTAILTWESFCLFCRADTSLYSWPTLTSLSLVIPCHLPTLDLLCCCDAGDDVSQCSSWASCNTSLSALRHLAIHSSTSCSLLLNCVATSIAEMVSPFRTSNKDDSLSLSILARPRSRDTVFLSNPAWRANLLSRRSHWPSRATMPSVMLLLTSSRYATPFVVTSRYHSKSNQFGTRKVRRVALFACRNASVNRHLKLVFCLALCHGSALNRKTTYKRSQNLKVCLCLLYVIHTVCVCVCVIAV